MVIMELDVWIPSEPKMCALSSYVPCRGEKSKLTDKDAGRGRKKATKAMGSSRNDVEAHKLLALSTLPGAAPAGFGPFVLRRCDFPFPALRCRTGFGK